MLFRIVVPVLLFVMAAGAGAVSLQSGQAPQWNRVIEDRLEDSTVEGRLELAIAYANTGQLELSLSVFQELEQIPDVKETMKQIVHRLEGENDGGIVWTNKMAFAHYSLLEFDKASLFFEAACQLEPENVWLRHFTALTYGKLEDVDSALSHLLKALEVDPGNEYTHLLLGMAYYQKRDYIRTAYHYLKSPNARKKIAEYF